MYLIVSLSLLHQIDAYIFEMAERNCSFVNYNLCVQKSSSFEKTLLISLKCIKKQNPACQSFPEDTMYPEKLKEYICSQPVGWCEKFSEIAQCLHKSICQFPLRYFEDAKNAFIPVPDVVMATNVYKRLNCIKKDRASKCQEELSSLEPPKEPVNFTNWVFEKYFDILHALHKCHSSESFDKECVKSLTLRAPACVFNDEAAQVSIKRIFEKSGSKVFRVTDHAVGYDGFCQGEKDVLEEVRKVQKEGCETEYQIEGRVNHFVCNLKDPRYILLMQSMAKKLVTSASDEMNRCIFDQAGPVPDKKDLFINWFCKEDYKMGSSQGNIHSLLRWCDKNLQVNTGSCDKSWHLFLVADAFEVKSHQLMCNEAKDFAFDITLDLWEYKEVLPERMTDFAKCTSMVNAPMTKRCYNKVGKLNGTSDPTIGEDFKQAYCSSNPLSDSFVDQIRTCLQRGEVPVDAIDICSAFDKDEEPVTRDIYECTKQLNKESTDRCLELFVPNKSEFEAQLKEKPVQSNYFARCIKYYFSQEYEKKLFGICMTAVQNRDRMNEDKNRICVKKDAQFGYQLFNPLKCIYTHSDLIKTMTCYKERFGKYLPHLGEVRTIRDWYCKQDNGVLELAKVRSCFTPRFAFWNCMSN